MDGSIVKDRIMSLITEKNVADECALPDDSNLVRLKQITKKLQFHELVRSIADQEILELEMEQGTGYMVGLFKNATIAVARNYASAECLFPSHSHTQWELLVVYQGEMHLSVEGKTVTLKEKEFYYIKPGTEHSAYFPEESWFLAITMPAADSWPKGG